MQLDNKSEGISRELLRMEVSASAEYAELADQAAIALGLGQQGRHPSLRYSRGGVGADPIRGH